MCVESVGMVCGPGGGAGHVLSDSSTMGSECRLGDQSTPQHSAGLLHGRD